MRIYPELLVDQEFKSLGDQGFSGTLNDRQFAFLRSKGYVNALPDMMTSWLSYSPANLFALNEPGIWLDPSDVANLDWRRNLLTYTEQFDNAAWTKSNATVSANVADPAGGTTADTITATANSAHVLQQITVATGQNMVPSVWIRRRTGTGTINMWNAAGSTVNITSSVSSSWSRVSVPVAIAGSGPFFFLQLATSGDAVDIWGAQLELGSVATDYQRISDVNTEVLERFPNTTMFVERNGTGPVTTPGQSVGLRLDKSKGLVLGSELVVNGDFSAGTTGWSASFVTLSAVAGKMRVTSTADFARSNATPFTTVVGRTYLVTGSVDYISGPENLYMYKSDDGAAVNQVGTATTGGRGDKRFVFVATSTTSYVAVAHRFSGTVADWDNISVKELPGNHAVANSDAARGIYGIEPVGGRRNLLTFTEQFDNAIWQKIQSSISTNAAVAPDGTTTADKFVPINTTPQLEQILTVAAASTVSGGCYFKAAEKGFGYIQINGLTGGTTRASFVSVNLSTGAVGTITALAGGGLVSPTASVSDAGNGWWRLTLSGGIGASNTTATTYVGMSDAQDSRSVVVSGSNGILIWGAQLETGSTATAYQRVTDQYNVTEAGKQTLHYVQYDGSDDGYVTPTISPESALVPTGPELVTNGNFATDTDWTKGSGWTIGSGVATRTSVGAQSFLEETAPVVNGVWYAVSFTVTALTSGDVGIRLGSNAIGNHITGTATGTYTGFAQCGGTDGKVYMRASSGFAGSIDNVSVRAVSGVADKVQVFAGVRKLSDAALGVVVEHSANVGANNGTFYLLAPNSNGTASYGFGSKGTSFSGNEALGFTAPVTNVLTMTANIAQPIAALRSNGSQVAQATGTQGTGNYLAYPLYIGRRGGTTLPFNGRDYGIITRFGANLDASTIAATESWLNQKTGAF